MKEPVTQTPPSDPDRLSARTLLAYSVAGIPYNLGTDGVKSLANPIYNILLGVNPALIGAALMVIRICDAFTDPIVGNFSDNARTRWGRRRPFIALGIMLCAVTFPLIWFVPAGSSHTFALVYLFVSALIFYFSFSIFCVPFVSLAMELSPDYSERTRITGVRTIFSSVGGLIAAWGFRLAQIDLFPDPLTGMRSVGVLIGLIILCAGLPVALFTRERAGARIAKQPKQPFVASFRSALKNVPFRVILGMVLLMMLGNYTASSLGIYVTTYYVYGGDFKAGAMFAGLLGTAGTMLNFAVVPIIIAVAARWGKTRILAACICLGALGGALRWVIITPAHPYLQLIEPLFMVPASSGFFVLMNSMKADTCDWDELQTGVRREGVYASVFSWLTKFSTAVTYSLGGLLLVFIGFQQELGREQAPGTLLNLRLAYSIIPVASFGAALLLLRFYPLSPRRMLEIRNDLEARRGRD